MCQTKRNAGKRGKGDLTRRRAIKWRGVREINHAQHAVVVVFIVSLALPSSRFTFEVVYWQHALHWWTTSLYDAHIFRLYSLHIYIYNKGSVCISSHLLGRPSSPLDQILQFALWKSNTRWGSRTHSDSRVCLCACFLPSSCVCWGYTRRQRPALPPRSAPPWLFSSHSHLILRELNVRVRVCAREGARGGYANAQRGPRWTPSTWRHTFLKNVSFWWTAYRCEIIYDDLTLL